MENHGPHQVYGLQGLCESQLTVRKGTCKCEVRATGRAPRCQCHRILSFGPQVTSAGLGYKQMSTCPGSRRGGGKIQGKAQRFPLPLKSQQTVKHLRLGALGALLGEETPSPSSESRRREGRIPGAAPEACPLEDHRLGVGRWAVVWLSQEGVGSPDTRK